MLRHDNSALWRARWARTLAGAMAAALTVLVVTAVPAHAIGTTLYVPNSAANTVSVVDASSGTITGTIPVGNDPWFTAPTPDGSKVLVSNLGSNTVSVISTDTDTVTATIPIGQNPAQIAVSPSGTTAYVGSLSAFTGMVFVLSLVTDTVIGSIFLAEEPEFLALNPAGTRLYVSRSLDSTMDVIDTSTNAVISTIDLDATTNKQVVMSPDGSRLYVLSGDNFFLGQAVEVVDTSSGTVTANIQISAGVQGAAITPDGAELYVTSGFGGIFGNSVSVVSTATNTVTSTIRGFTSPIGITINNSGTTAYIADWSKDTVFTVDTATNTITGSISGFSEPYYLSEAASSYNFTGFSAPVDDPPAVNQLNAGQAIPLNWSLDGNQGLNIFKPGYPAVTQVNCATGVPVGTVTPAATAGGSGLQFDAATGTYTYVWKTLTSYQGTCQQIELGLNDGSSHTALFQFS